jgi:hypothetical protein
MVTSSLYFQLKRQVRILYDTIIVESKEFGCLSYPLISSCYIASSMHKFAYFQVSTFHYIVLKYFE